MVVVNMRWLSLNRRIYTLCLCGALLLFGMPIEMVSPAESSAPPASASSASISPFRIVGEGFAALLPMYQLTPTQVTHAQALAPEDAIALVARPVQRSGQPQYLGSLSGKLWIQCGESDPAILRSPTIPPPEPLDERDAAGELQALTSDASGKQVAAALGHELWWGQRASQAPCPQALADEWNWTSRGLETPWIQSIAFWNSACLAAGTPDGLFLLQREGPSTFYPLEGVRTLSAQNGRLLIGTRTGELFLSNEVTTNGCPFKASFTPPPIQTATSEGSQPSIAAITAVFWEQSTLVMGDQKGRIFRGSLSSNTIATAPISLTNVWQTVGQEKDYPIERLVVSTGHIWVSTGSHIMALDWRGAQKIAWDNTQGIADFSAFATWLDEADQYLWMGTHRISLTQLKYFSSRAFRLFKIVAWIAVFIVGVRWILKRLLFSGRQKYVATQPTTATIPTPSVHTESSERQSRAHSGR